MEKFIFKFDNEKVVVKSSDLEAMFNELQYAKSMSKNETVNTHLHCVMGYLWRILEEIEG